VEEQAQNCPDIRAVKGRGGTENLRVNNHSRGGQDSKDIAGQPAEVRGGRGIEKKNHSRRIGCKGKSSGSKRRTELWPENGGEVKYMAGPVSKIGRKGAGACTTHQMGWAKL